MLRAYPGVGSVLLAFDVPAALADDLAGFAIQATQPGRAPTLLTNRLTFDEPITTDTSPAERQQISTDTEKAPLQKFHWTHFPSAVVPGDYLYRAVAMLFEKDSERDLRPGPEAAVSLELADDGFPAYSLGFTRGYVSSQAYASRFKNRPLQPSPQTIDFDTKPYAAQYEWLGSSASQLVFDFLAEASGDQTTTLDVFAYDLNEPQIVRTLSSLGPRLRLFQDDSDSHVAAGRSHPLELDALRILRASAGADHVKVGHFSRFQHNKVMILRRDGRAVKVLSGSANFSVRGLYVQSNNVFVLDNADMAGVYAQAFDQAWSDPSTSAFEANSVSQQWFAAGSPALPKFSVSLSPHRDAGVSLGPVADAVRAAKSSVLFAIMEIGAGSGQLLDEIRRLPQRPELYAFGTTQRLDGALAVTKPGQQSPFIPFSYLKDRVPPPFQKEYSGGSGQVIHHKFVVVDFNDDAPKVFAGSSNLAEGGEKANGDNLVAIENARVAAAYAVEAVGLIDHYRFRAVQQQATDESPLRLKTRSERWAADFFDSTNPKFHERTLFAQTSSAA